MIRALRRARLAPLAAAVALFAMMPVTMSSFLHDGTDDTACNPPLVIHDAAAHRIGNAPAAPLPQSEHCILCHELQALRAVSNVVRFAAPVVDARIIAVATPAAARTELVSNRPARAPPSA